jgi:hypothetical protein
MPAAATGRTLRNIFTGTEIVTDDAIPAASVFAHMPIAILTTG